MSSLHFCMWGNLGRQGVYFSSYNFPPPPFSLSPSSLLLSLPSSLPLFLFFLLAFLSLCLTFAPLLSPPFSFPPRPSQWITESSGLIAIHSFCLPSCSSQKPCCLSLHRKDDFLLSKTIRRGCWVSFSSDSNYKGPIASCSDITSDLFKPFPLMITFSIRDKNICSFWVKEQPDYSFIRKWGRSLLQSNWLTGFRIRKCKSLTVRVALLLSQWNPQLSKWVDMWSG